MYTALCKVTCTEAGFSIPGSESHVDLLQDPGGFNGSPDETLSTFNRRQIQRSISGFGNIFSNKNLSFSYMYISIKWYMKLYIKFSLNNIYESIKYFFIIKSSFNIVTSKNVSCLLNCSSLIRWKNIPIFYCSFKESLKSRTDGTGTIKDSFENTLMLSKYEQNIIEWFNKSRTRVAVHLVKIIFCTSQRQNTYIENIQRYTRSLFDSENPCRCM